MAQFDFRITRDESFERVIANLHAAGQGRVVRPLLEREIRKEGRPTVAAVRAAVRHVNVRAAPPSKHPGRGGRKGRGLRSTIAGAVQVSTRNVTAAGIRIEVALGRMPPGMRSLPAYVDGRGRWRHPVFGNTNVWVGQRGEPWFVPTILKHTPQFRAAVQRAMDRVRDQIT